MDANTFADIATKLDWSECYHSVTFFQKLAKPKKEALANSVIDRLAASSGNEFLNLVKFFRGHLHLYHVPDRRFSDLSKYFVTHTRPKHSRMKYLNRLLGSSTLCQPKLTANTDMKALKLLLNLASSDNESVRVTATRVIGEIKRTEDPEGLNDQILQFLLARWGDTSELVSVRAAALHSLRSFSPWS